ncbi:hypothetical protein SAMN05421747_103205 [Parapedobacter composti]|uniref:Uncharacterized protein n=1 Tax=Parapedobacter composti TaxID=623281 RepID=A0A1I1G3H8_9SPHI|nr:hypothetical protein SAMN05421747_103205 [Parapedobacter composti]
MKTKTPNQLTTFLSSTVAEATRLRSTSRLSIVTFKARTKNIICAPE